MNNCYRVLIVLKYEFVVYLNNFKFGIQLLIIEVVDEDTCLDQVINLKIDIRNLLRIAQNIDNVFIKELAYQLFPFQNNLVV